jgi:hypothetical protein
MHVPFFVPSHSSPRPTQSLSLRAPDRWTSENGDLIKQAAYFASFTAIPSKSVSPEAFAFGFPDRFMSIRECFQPVIQDSVGAFKAYVHVQSGNTGVFPMNNEADDTHVRRPVIAIRWQCTYYHSSSDDIRHSDTL